MHKIPLVSGSIDIPEETNALRRESQGSNSIEVSIKENGEKDQAEQYQIKNPGSEWLINIKKKLDRAKNDDAPDSWEELCIYRIPRCLRDGNEMAYTPQIVSLGPYYHGVLSNMDPHKWRAVNRILERTDQEITTYLDAIKELEEKIRAYYEGPIFEDSDEFVEMMVLDSCFILELFRGAEKSFTELGYSKKDPIFTIRGSMHSIQRDMLMLENQIPLFVLDRLLGLQNPEREGAVALLALMFFDSLRPTDKSRSSFVTSTDGLHCLDLFRRNLLAIPDCRKATVSRQSIARSNRWSHRNWVADERRQQLIHCVMELKDVGIKFKKRETNIFCDVEFKDGVLNIPRLLIHDGTTSLFLNLIAYEQCHLDCSNDITLYALLMDNLIDSAADVSHLHDCEIIEHWLGSDAEVADLFNRLCREVVFYLDESNYSKLSEQINDYHKNRFECLEG